MTCCIFIDDTLVLNNSSTLAVDVKLSTLGYCQWSSHGFSYKYFMNFVKVYGEYISDSSLSNILI